MKKILFLTKTLLAVALLCVGQNAWGESVNGTLVHSASSFCSTDNSAFTSTVDSEKEHINNQGFSGTWAGAAYADFSFVIPSGHSVINAELTFTVAGSGKNRTADLSYVTAGTQLDYESMSGGSAKVNLSSTNISTGLSFPANSDKVHTINVTGAVQTIIAAGQANIIFKLTNNVGGGDLYGKGATEAKRPTLVITTSTAKTYTATFTETTSLDPTITIYSDAGRTTPVSNGALTDETTYYYRAVLEGYNDYEGSFTVSGANPSINFTMVAKAVYNYTVKSSLGTTIASGSAYENTIITVPYPQYELSGTTLYVATKNSNSDYWRKTFTLTSDNQEETITYTSNTANVVYYEEAEDIAARVSGITASYRTDANLHIRCSNAGGACTDKADGTEYIFTSLAPGKYKLSSSVWGNATATYVFKAGATQVLSLTTNGNVVDGTGDEFTVYETTDITISSTTGAWSNKVFDYVYIQRTGDATVSITPANAKSTYVTTYALDFTDVDGLDAYVATAAANGTVALEEVGAVPAGTPLILIGTAGTEYTVPVAASASAPAVNMLLAGDGTTAFNGSTYDYILYSDGLFYQIGSGTVATNKAYLHCDSNPTVKSGSSPARSLRIVFDGITGVDNVEAAAEAKAQDGKFVENGKIVIIKNGVKYNAAGQQVK